VGNAVSINGKQASFTDGPSGPLVGYRVLELCTTVAGPACARHFADFGAQVIKLEAPGGDPVRSMGFHEPAKEAGDEDVSLYAASILRNKQSIIVDLKKPKGVELALALASRCDVVVENFRPGVLERLGLGYDVLSKGNPGLVLVRISGYGQYGPLRDRPGYGTICEAFGGVRNVTGDLDRPPTRVSVALTDYATAIQAAFGAALALLERNRTGLGQVVDVALYEAAFNLMEPDVPAYDRLEIVAKREGSRFPGLAPNNIYPTRDGKHVLIAANNNAIFKRLCEVMERLELIDDVRFRTIRARASNSEDIDREVTAFTLTRDANDLDRLFADASVPSSLVYTMADAFMDPQYRARETILEIPHPTLGSVATVGLVPKLSRTPGRVYSAGPDCGRDTARILKTELNLTDEQVEELEREGVVQNCGTGK
jgi:crotonobetainyl-CoA:carnitine CoA-transferase CaiB-like acyl-CoA transferase